MARFWIQIFIWTRFRIQNFSYFWDSNVKQLFWDSFFKHAGILDSNLKLMGFRIQIWAYRALLLEFFSWKCMKDEETAGEPPAMPPQPLVGVPHGFGTSSTPVPNPPTQLHPNPPPSPAILSCLMEIPPIFRSTVDELNVGYCSRPAVAITAHWEGLY